MKQRNTWERRRKSHHNLDVWRLALDYATSVWALTSKMPSEERYVLSAQIRRAVLSIPSNIAEGAARSTRAENAHFLTIARGSASELETQLLLAHRLGYFTEDLIDFDTLDRISAMLSKMISNLRLSSAV